VAAVDVPVGVRWSDLDPLGHVNNVRMLEFVQESRVAMLKDMGVFEGTTGEFGTFTQVVARQEIDYLAPIFLTSDPVVRTGVSRIGNSSYDLHFTISTKDGVLAAQGRTVLVLVDAQTHVKVPIPEAFRVRLGELSV
jgi:acyl-CoA thioester hydrolase